MLNPRTCYLPGAVDFATYSQPLPEPMTSPHSPPADRLCRLLKCKLTGLLLKLTHRSAWSLCSWARRVRTRMTQPSTSSRDAAMFIF